MQLGFILTFVIWGCCALVEPAVAYLGHQCLGTPFYSLPWYLGRAVVLCPIAVAAGYWMWALMKTSRPLWKRLTASAGVLLGLVMINHAAESVVATLLLGKQVYDSGFIGLVGVLWGFGVRDVDKG